MSVGCPQQMFRVVQVKPDAEGVSWPACPSRTSNNPSVARDCHSGRAEGIENVDVRCCVFAVEIADVAGAQVDRDGILVVGVGRRVQSEIVGRFSDERRYGLDLVRPVIVRRALRGRRPEGILAILGVCYGDRTVERRRCLAESAAISGVRSCRAASVVPRPHVTSNRMRCGLTTPCQWRSSCRARMAVLGGRQRDVTPARVAAPCGRRVGGLERPR